MRQRVLLLTRRDARFYQRYATSAQDVVARPIGGLLVGCCGRRVTLETNRGEDVFGFDAVYMANWGAEKALARFAAQGLRDRGVPFVPGEALVGRSKLSDLYRFAGAGIRYPKTFYASAARMSALEAWATRTAGLAYPCVVKHIAGWRGLHNYRVRDREHLLRSIAAARVRSAGGFLLQQYIPNHCDYRVVVTGGEPTLIVRRTRRDDRTHTNNVSDGAAAEVLDRSDVDQSIWTTAVAAAGAVGRLDHCGVDLVVHEGTGECFLMEANEDPAMSDMHQQLKLPPVFQYLSRRSGGHGSFPEL